EAVTGDHQAEADNTNRPRCKRPQDDDDSDFEELTERPRISEHMHEPCYEWVLLVTATRQHVIRAETIDHFQDGRGNSKERDSDAQHHARPALHVSTERSVVALNVSAGRRQQKIVSPWS